MAPSNLNLRALLAGALILNASVSFPQTPSTGSGQAFPIKPIRIITAEPGGGNDLAARLIAPGLTAGMGQQVIVENRGGASGAIATQAVSKSPPDGYALLLYSSAIWILPLMQDVLWDPIRDFAPVTLAAFAPNILVVHPSLPVKTVKDLVALAKSRPGELNYATGGSGAAAHLAAELFKILGNVNMVRITYKGTGPGLVDLVGGQVQLMFPAAGAVVSHIKSNRLKALAVTSAKPSALAPGLPTVAAAGLPGYEAVSTYGVFAPAKTPSPVIGRLNQEMVRVLNRAEVRDQFFNAGVETAGSTAEEFAAAIRSDMVIWGKVIKQAGIRIE